MTLTRSQLGETPKKAEYPGFVETPGVGRRSTRARKSLAPTGESSTDASPSSSQVLEKKSSNGSATSPPAKRGRPSKKKVSAEQQSDEYEFGGPIGASAIIFFSPILMYFMWIGATYYKGKIPWPRSNESWSDFGQLLLALIYDGAFPSLKAWAIYWGFLIFQGLCYLYLPGIYAKGKALEWEGGKRLDYYCSGLWSFYLTNILALGLHATRIFRLDTIIDEFGPIMSVAIITGFAISIIAYISARYRGKASRMTGSVIYDFFMGAEINPRLFGWLDFKMFFEVRLPWYILYLVSMGVCARQYERYGYISGEALFLLMAHFLYANACSKAEEAIVTTWDIYYEKWGWMLIFWNLAGVPLTYCHGAIYLANNHPSTYHWNRIFLAFLYISYLFVYWVWDTCNSQKNRFRQMERGTLVERKTFPVLPWLTIKNPDTIKTKTGDSILVDGWYKYARKIHYTCDVYFAFTWGLITGFASPFPWFYVAFFVPMIFHRFLRDQAKCRKRYGAAWEEYERRVPYTFIPYVY